MASHLTISSAIAGTQTSRSFGAGAAQGSQGAGGVLGIFAALLGNNGSATPDISTSSQTSLDLDLGKAVSLGLETAFGDAEGETPDPEILAAVIDLGTRIATPPEPGPVIELVDAMAGLKRALDAGEPLDPELLADVESALTELAEALGLDLDALPVPEDFAALLEGTADDTGLAGTLTTLLAPVAAALKGAQKATDAAGIAGETAATEQVKTVGDKLAALLAALEGDAVPEEALAAIGAPVGEEPAEDIRQALARFAAGVPTAAEVPAEPELATPALKLTEPVLTGEKPELKAERQDDTAARRPDVPRDTPAPVEARERRPEQPVQPQATAAAAPVDAAPVDPASAPAQQASSPRVDSAATTRVVVQAGYQTSQQQLNLPQIAFELARQAGDGNTRFQIRLDPPELGRIDVRLEFDNAGQVNARLTVEKSETLDLMQRDQRGLERALQQAGIDAGKTNLEFSLKQNPFAGQAGDERNGRPGSGPATGSDQTATTDETAEPAPTVNLYRGTLQARGVNIIA